MKLRPGDLLLLLPLLACLEQISFQFYKAGLAVLYPDITVPKAHSPAMCGVFQHVDSHKQ